MEVEWPDMLMLHLIVHDVYNTSKDNLCLYGKPYIKFYWKNIKYKNYFKCGSDEISYFCEFFLPYKSGDYIENLIIQIWANSYFKKKKKIAYNYININNVEKEIKIDGKIELIGKTKGFKMIYTLQIIYYSLYKFMKTKRILILENISIYKMLQVYKKYVNSPLECKQNLLEQYLLSLFHTNDYFKSDTPLRLKSKPAQDVAYRTNQCHIATNTKPSKNKIILKEIKSQKFYKIPRICIHRDKISNKMEKTNMDAKLSEHSESSIQNGIQNNIQNKKQLAKNVKENYSISSNYSYDSNKYEHINCKKIANPSQNMIYKIINSINQKTKAQAIKPNNAKANKTKHFIDIRGKNPNKFIENEIDKTCNLKFVELYGLKKN
ncbi:conserved Plasmodium protein, unknown function [Plasmodium berghei]|uniref:Uncharacterized protein n=3 Tax=Plasmodium berghei TaxID=5821 RepID=A0A509AMP6_PLABA|nr:conserved Plasmodium protein, unknown function [Plasmodium berghei ANKA]CXI66652.1 conserved Plasmodium protein, unknown function [Plasmodium berghei]SCO61325.1 conserved Plasmodium protein, unknown function [Plasmodium berghei]VUC56734.1 conserved Plasmodium protein, unknown function [Plasmodium berghei ANKA]|eukprot:XP_034422520.1 conserved Plasmodium protein, unknown function [Plasmodium berghei ANKA]